MIRERNDPRRVVKDRKAEASSTIWEPGHDGEMGKGRKSSYPRESRLLSVNRGVDVSPSPSFIVLQRKQHPPQSLLPRELSAHGKERLSDGFQSFVWPAWWPAPCSRPWIGYRLVFLVLF